MPCHLDLAASERKRVFGDGEYDVHCPFCISEERGYAFVDIPKADAFLQETPKPARGGDVFGIHVDEDGVVFGAAAPRDRADFKSAADLPCLAERNNFDIVGKIVLPFTQTNDDDGFALTREALEPCMKKPENRVLRINGLRANQKTHGALLYYFLHPLVRELEAFFK